MLLGRVTGTVVASQKEPLMEGLTFLLVRQLAVDNTEANSYVVAVDSVGAGVGEVRDVRIWQLRLARPASRRTNLAMRCDGHRRHLGIDGETVYRK